MPNKYQRSKSTDVIYIAHLIDAAKIKIGVTGDLVARMRTYKKEHGAVVVLAVARGSFELERETRGMFQQYAIPYRRAGRQPEFFTVQPEIIEYAGRINDAVLLGQYHAEVKRLEQRRTPTPPTASANAAANAA